jgi:hypothetical protein
VTNVVDTKPTRLEALSNDKEKADGLCQVVGAAALKSPLLRLGLEVDQSCGECQVQLPIIAPGLCRSSPKVWTNNTLVFRLHNLYY